MSGGVMGFRTISEGMKEKVRRVASSDNLSIRELAERFGLGMTTIAYILKTGKIVTKEGPYAN
jgi:transposase